ncbi:Na+/H+ antiporter NhaC [Anoxybacillus voinovskiensis]|uniref:Na+/H+ antiporter NhaC n=1 Tax=Anoxybacteroides voinovskiense TaxID=230470 RepID=A0A840DFU7_9BACL|nr:Na+/H+ antiporter NhaC family protein [Anoxybacillus voinovskiensis]MBB4072281.1 Na+/H+ antiporter NhaC [Anoxybacillus voinovskiensis]GGJ59158.1 sodium:proton antiporter [Anoxybacillus voinovskiensis]
MEGTWVSLIPFLLVIPLAIWLKEILPGLVVGLLVGAFCLEGQFFSAIERAVNAMLEAATNGGHMQVILFLYLFGALIGMMQITGGVKGFVQWISPKIHSKRRMMGFIWLTLPVTFFTPMFRIMLLAPVMKPLSEKFRMDKRRMAYMIDVSTEPIIVLLPLATAFIGFMTSVVEGALKQNNITQSAYPLFLASLPYNFFAVIALIIGIVTTFRHVQIGKEERAHVESETNYFHRLGLKKELSLVVGEPLHLFFPLFLLFVCTIFFLWYDGKTKGATTLLAAFSHADATFVMLVALFLTIALTAIFYFLRRQKLHELIYHFFEGGNELMAPISMLLLVWALSLTAEQLGFSSYISATFGTFLPKEIVPAAMFILGSFISYFIGTSWGTWGLFMPLGVTLAAATGASLPMTIGAVFASGTFGAFASPLGDTTITTASIMDLDLMEYAKYKLRISLVCGLLALVGYLIFPLVS